MATRSWNRVELIGNLTRDPEVRFTPSGSAVCTFTIATNRTYISEGEKKEEADFHRIVAWNKLAELCGQLLKKGNRVFVSGRLQNRSWEGTDGSSRQVTEIVIEDMIILTAKTNTASNEDYTAETTPSSGLSTASRTKPVDKPETKVESVTEEQPVAAGDSSSKEEKTSKPDKTEEIDNLDDLPF